MSTSADPFSTRSGFSRRFLARHVVLFGCAVFLFSAGFFVPQSVFQLIFFTSATAIFFVGVAGRVKLRLENHHLQAGRTQFDTLLAHDAIPSIVADLDGQVITANSTALERLKCDTADGLTLVDLLDKTLANPDDVLWRMQAKACSEGSAQQDVRTGHGKITLTAHRVSEETLVWRLVETASRSTLDYEELSPPMMMLGRTGAVLHMNDKARILLGRQVASLGDLGSDVGLRGGMSEIETAEGRRRVFVHVLETGTSRRAVLLLPVDADAEQEDGWFVFENLPVPLLKVSPNGHVQAFNATAAHMIGVGLQQDAHLSEFMEGLGRPITDWLQDTLAGRVAHPSEFLRLKRADKEVFVQVTLNRVVEKGEPCLIAVLNDATELKSLEAQFVQSQKMQAIGQLAGGVAHDFNNLLTAISGHCDLLLLRHDQGDPDFSDLVQINQNANRAAALVGQLLAFSRKQTLRPETLDVRDTLSDLTHLLNRLVGEKVALTLNHDPVLRPIRADKRQLEQVMMNLVVNARDAMPHGGDIRMVTACIKLSEALNRDRVSVPPGEYVVVRVSDEGIGIPPDKLQKVFEPFFTTKRTGEGTGLGLSTAYGIVKQTGGYIFVDSAVGKGTCFSLYFPVLEKVPRPPEKSQNRAHRPSGKHGDGVILLVEDEAPVRAFASRALRLRGYTVLEADSAESALKTLEDESLSVDVFVTDVVMPGMDGPSWVREALKERPDVRVVFVSGYAEDSFGEAQVK
ncbi:MAG: ATP-binding protein, partial [Pseudomonadota bacterium]